MTIEHNHTEFPVHSEENRRIWDANARWWDDQIGEGNDFQSLLIEPATDRLLDVRADERILDVACGAGRFARRMADQGARVIAFDYSAAFIARARERTSKQPAIEYHVVDAANLEHLLALGATRFHKAVCTMALMDMPEVRPLFTALAQMLTPGGIFVFSITHPCFHSAAIQRFAEIDEANAGGHTIRAGVKVSRYLAPFAMKTAGIIGQPEAPWFFHRPINALLRCGFDAGFVLDGIEEPGFPNAVTSTPGVRWRDMPDIPPIMVVRMKLMPANQ